jgi:hypothetical protein
MGISPIENNKNKKPPKPLIRLVAALMHYVVNPSIATLLHNIKTASMYIKGVLRSIFIIISQTR